MIKISSLETNDFHECVRNDNYDRNFVLICRIVTCPEMCPESPHTDKLVLLKDICIIIFLTLLI